MAEGGGSSLKGLREQMVAAAQAIAEERRNQSGVSPVPVQTAISIKTATKPVIDGSTLRTEERQRLARERREEREKQNAAKETQIFEKEKKAKLQYEKQMEERQRKLKEQKQKEEQRRAAVEEKRKQKIEEEKERYEAVVHRTLERSQRLETRQKRWSWGGSITSDLDSKTEPQITDEGGPANKRSTSTANLKQTEAVINKRLSSSAALLNSPDRSTTKRSASLNRLSNKVSLQSQQPPPKGSQVEQKGGTEKKRSTSLTRMSSKPHSSPELEKVKKEERPARRSQISPLESNVISRLLAPTQASLARSKSAATLSADGQDPSESHLCPRSASASSISSPVQTPKVPMRSRSIDRLKSTVSSSDTSSPESTQKSETEKQSPSPAGRRPPSPSVSARRRSPSPANLAKRPSSPSTARSNQKARPPSPSVLKQRPSSPTTVSKPAPIQRPSLTPSVINITKKKPEMECKPKDKCEEGAGQEHVTSQTSERETVATAAKTKEESSSKTIPGTTTAEEAAKILAEKRRLAREQREREEQERIQREEEKRSREEEMVKKMIEDQVQREEELLRLEEEKRLDYEEQQRQAEEERVRKEQEEQEKLAELQQQREEAEAKAQEEAERQRQERERIMQQNMQERLERKKRIEEIMKRTRKSDQNEAKNEEKSANEADEEEEEDVEEEGELDLEKTYQSENINGVDLSQEIKVQMECSSEVACGLTSTEPSVQDMSKMEADEVLMNGDEQDINQKNNNGGSLHVTQLKGYSPSAKEMVIQNSEILHVNEADHTIGLIQNLNGKSNAWTFEEIIDLGVHSKSTKLSSESITAANCNQNLNDAATVPSSPKLAFEDDATVNSLTKPIETASEL